MEKMGLNEIREKFLSFFESKGCLRLGSFPLIPKGDPSLLLINSGMAPMKHWFTGEEIPPRKRVTTCQKCIRTPDIERVGHTARHGTFFEMLGNFSFGDYFKREAITWAWEFFTEVMKIPKEVLWITIYEDDDEAFDIWTKEVGVSPERVVRMGKEDNFWEHGTGPCGPCSEIHVDRGIEYACGPDCKIGCDCDRFMELWNLVFTQFDKDEAGNYNRLPNPNIDTGMGLERLAAYMQGVENLFEVDTVQGVMKHICKIANVSYHDDAKKDVSLRVITDHVRSTVMMISDGVIPSNEGRGYVLRRLLRRAARHGKLLGIDHTFLYEVCDTVINESKSAYPELVEKREYIKKIIQVEEERFDATVDNGLMVLNGYIEEAKKNGVSVIDGEQTFKLHDTYGFPLDLTVEIAGEAGLSVDTDGFNSAMQKQKDEARAARKDSSSWETDAGFNFEGVSPTEFEGYDTLECKSKIVSIVNGGEISSLITKGEKGSIVLEKTPFYAEMGGQCGDIGIIKTESATAKVTDTKKNGDGIYLHEVEIIEGEFKNGDDVMASVDEKNRMAVCRNHSVTHLLDQALRDTLGVHVAQAGSSVTADRLRFDFSHFSAMTEAEIKTVEDKVNDAILAAMPIETLVLPIEEAKKTGAVSLFGEKYGDVVRVVKMGDYSTEFCGGTHLKNTSQAGLFTLISESGVAAGVRRIEAVTGYGALALMKEDREKIAETAKILKTNPSDITVKAKACVDEAKSLSKEIEKLRAKMAGSQVDDILSNPTLVKGVNVYTAKLSGIAAGELRGVGDKMRDKMDIGICVLSSVDSEGKISFVAAATKSAVSMGVHCGNVIRSVAQIAGGGGGGKPDGAQAGGKDASKIDEALKAVAGLVEGQIK